MTDASTTGAVERFACDELGMDRLADGEWVRFTDYKTAIQRVERWQSIAQTHLDQLQSALLEGRKARAQAAAMWNGGFAAGLEQGQNPCGCHDCYDASLPPADLSAALTARLDAEWNAAIEAAADFACHWHKDEQPDLRDDIRAIRRAAPTEGEA